MILTERPRCYKKMSATKLPPDNSLHFGTSITTSSLHAATEVSKLNGNVMMEKTKKIGEKKTGSKRKGNLCNDKKRGSKLLKKLIPQRIQQTLKKWKLKNLQTTPDHEGLQRAEKSSILKMTLMCWKRNKSC